MSNHSNQQQQTVLQFLLKKSWKFHLSFLKLFFLLVVFLSNFFTSPFLFFSSLAKKELICKIMNFIYFFTVICQYFNFPSLSYLLTSGFWPDLIWPDLWKLCTSILPLFSIWNFSLPVFYLKFIKCLPNKHLNILCKYYVI